MSKIASAPEPTMSDVLARVDADTATQQMATAIETLDEAAGAVETKDEPQKPTPFVYNTATNEAARDLVNKRDMLAALIGEDDHEIDFINQSYEAEVEKIRVLREAEDQRLFDMRNEAADMVEARRADRMAAHQAYGAVIDALQKGKNNG